MPYTLPTAAQLKAKFPRFVPLDDGRVDEAIADAEAEVPVTWAEGDYQQGILYLAAHLLVIDNALYAPPSEDTGGGGVDPATLEEKMAQATAISVGDVKVNFSSSGSSGGTTQTSSGFGVITGKEALDSTVFGQRFLMLKRRNSPGAFTFLRA